VVAACLIGAVVGIGLSMTPLRIALPGSPLLRQRTNVLIMGLDRTVSERNPKVV